MRRNYSRNSSRRIIVYVVLLLLFGFTIFHFLSPRTEINGEHTETKTPPTTKSKPPPSWPPKKTREPPQRVRKSDKIDDVLLRVDESPIPQNISTKQPSSLSLCPEMRKQTQNRLIRREGKTKTYPIPLSDVHYPDMEDIAPRNIEECSSESHPDASRLPRCSDPQLFYQATFKYPPYEMAYPNFIRESDRSLFQRLPPILQYYHPEHSACPTPSVCDSQDYTQDKDAELVMWSDDVTVGQVSIVTNGTYRGKPTPSFGDGACEKRANYKWISPKDNTSPFTYKRIATAVGPQSTSFQHFINRLLPRLIQAWEWIRPDKPESEGGGYRLIVPSGEQAGVRKLWNVLGFEHYDPITNPSGRLIPGKNAPKAEEMLFPCVNPHWHPWHYRRMQELIGVDPSVPLEERNKVIYLTRSKNSRKVLNEADLIDTIRRTVKDINENYELIVFEHKNYPTADDLRRLFANVRAIIGPHGGAWYNCIWAPAGTLAVELLPVQGTQESPKAMRWPEVMWWISRFFGHRHWSVPVITRGGGDITVDPQRIVDILHCAL